MPSRLLERFVRAEANIERLPYFAPSKRANKKRLHHELADEVERNGAKLLIRWRIDAHPRWGFPCEGDRSIYLALLKVIDEDGVPADGALRFPSFYRVLATLYPEGVDPKQPECFGGWYYRRVEASIRRMQATVVTSAGAFYDKAMDAWVEDQFSLVDRFIRKGKKLPTGEIAEHHTIYLGSWLLDSLRTNFRKPVDLSYHLRLDRPVARSLYSFLDGRFYGLALRGVEDAAYMVRYDKLCSYLILTAQPYKSLALQKIQPSLDELVNTGFLATWSFEDAAGGGWKLSCKPGTKFWQDFRENNRQLSLFPTGGHLQTSLPLPEPIPSDANVVSASEQDKGDQLITSPAAGNEAAAIDDQAAIDLVHLFHRRRHDLDDDAPVKARAAKKHLEFARELITSYGEDAAWFMVEEGARLIAERGYKVHSFGYLESLLSELEAAWRREEVNQETRQRQRKDREREQEERRQYRAYQAHCEDLFDAFWGEQVSDEERAALEDKARTELKQQMPGASKEAIEDGLRLKIQQLLEWKDRVLTFEEWARTLATEVQGVDVNESVDSTHVRREY